MGTRNLTCVIKNGDFRVAQYGQWDGYPEGAGADILAFLNVPGNIDKLRSRVDEVRFISRDEWNERLTAAGIGDSIRYGSEEEKKYQRDFWQLDRNVGRKVLKIIVATEGPVELMDDREFAHNSLFCEWAYVVNMDHNVLEVYKGFNKDPLAPNGVFAGVPLKEDRSNEYATVKLVAVYPFHSLPTVKVMKEQCDPQESENE